MTSNIDNIIIPKNADKIINLLNSKGHKAYVVGGCVRDYILGKNGGDVDITTSAKPILIEQILTEQGIKVVETGLKHGTVTAIIDSEQYEITTFRKDGEYEDNRHPQNVLFVDDVKEDLSRRDFTINAMAYNHSDGIVDLFGGKEDINNKLIRAVGNPNKRFNEDALRIMRAIRFSSVLGFEIEKETKKAVFDNKELLKNVSVERLYVELIKLLLGDNVLNVLSEYKDVIAVIIPELKQTFDCEQNTPWHIYNVYDHIINAVNYAPKNEVIRLTMLLHDIGKPLVKTTDSKGIDHFKTHAAAGAEIAKSVLKRFNISNKIYDEVTTLVYYHQSIENVEKVKVKRWLSKFGEEYTRDLFLVRIADLKAHNVEKTDYEIKMMYSFLEELNEIIARGDAVKISDLAVNGNDIKSLGYNGVEIGQKLKEILSLVVDDKLINDKNIIIKYIINNK